MWMQTIKYSVASRNNIHIHSIWNKNYLKNGAENKKLINRKNAIIAYIIFLKNIKYRN